MNLPKVRIQNPVTIPKRAPSSTVNGAGMASALGGFFVYWYNNYTPFIDLDQIMAVGVVTVFTYIGAWMTKERRYYMDRRAP